MNICLKEIKKKSYMNFKKLIGDSRGLNPRPTAHYGFKVVVKIICKFHNIFAALEYYEMLEIYGEFGDVPGNLIINWGNLSGVIFKGLITLRWPANDAPASVIQF